MDCGRRGNPQLAPDQFMDLTFEPMVTRDVEGEWSNAVSDEFMDELLDMVESEDVTYDHQAAPVSRSAGIPGQGHPLQWPCLFRPHRHP